MWFEYTEKASRVRKKTLVPIPLPLHENILHLIHVTPIYIDLQCSKRCEGRNTITHNRLKQWTEINNPDDLAINILAASENLDKVINDSDLLLDDWIGMLIKVFAKCCEVTDNSIKISVLAMLQNTPFVKENLDNYMTEIGMKAEDDIKTTLCQNLLHLMKTYFMLFPSNYKDMPVNSLIILATKIKNREHLQLQVRWKNPLPLLIFICIK